VTPRPALILGFQDRRDLTSSLLAGSPTRPDNLVALCLRVTGSHAIAVRPQAGLHALFARLRKSLPRGGRHRMIFANARVPHDEIVRDRLDFHRRRGGCGCGHDRGVCFKPVRAQTDNGEDSQKAEEGEGDADGPFSTGHIQLPVCLSRETEPNRRVSGIRRARHIPSPTFTLHIHRRRTSRLTEWSSADNSDNANPKIASNSCPGRDTAPGF
jgi:hypothetical protein